MVKSKNIFYISDIGLDKLFARCRSGAIGRAKHLIHAQFFGYTHFARQNRKKPLDIQVFSRIGKTTKMNSMNEFQILS